MPAKLQSVRDIMRRDPISVQRSSSVLETAEKMRDNDIGDVLVMDDRKIYGILTDRDIVIRAIASGKNAAEVPVGDVCTKNPTALSPTDAVDRAIQTMREKAIRRLPVVENKRPVGIVSLGDLAMGRDPRSALADISAARPDR